MVYGAAPSSVSVKWKKSAGLKCNAESAGSKCGASTDGQHSRECRSGNTSLSGRYEGDATLFAAEAPDAAGCGDSWAGACSVARLWPAIQRAAKSAANALSVPVSIAPAAAADARRLVGLCDFSRYSRALASPSSPALASFCTNKQTTEHNRSSEFVALASKRSTYDQIQRHVVVARRPVRVQAPEFRQLFDRLKRRADFLRS